MEMHMFCRTALHPLFVALRTASLAIPAVPHNATNLKDGGYYATCLSHGVRFVRNRRTVIGTVSYSYSF